MRVLIGCEYSGRVREAFRKRGHDAWSVDLLPSEDNSPQHVVGDVFEMIDSGHWDLMIAHPPCTYLTNSAEWAYGDGPYHQKVKPETLVGEARREARREAVMFVKRLMASPIGKIAIENPVGALSKYMRKPNQTIQPHWFGHYESKATCIWLHGLPLLVPTNQVYAGPAWVRCDDCDDFRCTLHGEHVADCKCPGIDTWARKGIDPYTTGGRWENQTASGQNAMTPSADRWKERSRTYRGIANAMAEQWG